MFGKSAHNPMQSFGDEFQQETTMHNVWHKMLCGHDIMIDVSWVHVRSKQVEDPEVRGLLLVDRS